MTSIKILILCASVIMLAACGGGGSEPPVTTATPSVGVFVDSAVGGLQYQAPSYSGSTNTLGEFNYLPGERITFSIGDIVLGSAQAGAIITPLSLVPGASGANDPTVTNIVRLLLTLDDDNNPDNGINLGNEITVAAQNLSINFSAADLSADPGVNSLLTALPAQPTLIDNETAQAHFSASLATQSNWGTMAWGGGIWKSATP